MGEIVNLRQAKRRLARAKAAQDAQENRIRHGRTRTQTEVERLDAARREAVTSGAKLEPEGDER